MVSRGIFHIIVLQCSTGSDPSTPLMGPLAGPSIDIPTNNPPVFVGGIMWNPPFLMLFRCTLTYVDQTFHQKITGITTNITLLFFDSFQSNLFLCPFGGFHSHRGTPIAGWFIIPTAPNTFWDCIWSFFLGLNTFSEGIWSIREWKIPWNWMIWGYPFFRKPPCSSSANIIRIRTYHISTVSRLSPLASLAPQGEQWQAGGNPERNGCLIGKSSIKFYINMQFSVARKATKSMEKSWDGSGDYI